MKKLIVILLVALFAFSPLAAQRVWEEVETPVAVSDHGQTADNGEQVDIAVRDGYLYITTPKAISVKIFSILGQLIAQKDLQPGTYRTRIAARGIYILKIGSLTRRITI